MVDERDIPKTVRNRRSLLMFCLQRKNIRQFAYIIENITRKIKVNLPNLGLIFSNHRCRMLKEQVYIRQNRISAPHNSDYVIITLLECDFSVGIYF